MPILHLPTLMQQRAQCGEKIELVATNYDTLCKEIKREHPSLSELVFDQNGQQYGYIQFILDESLYTEQTSQKLCKNTELYLLTAMSGG